jgi:hypothetical protein
MAIAAAAQDADLDRFEKKIRPVLAERCCLPQRLGRRTTRRTEARFD